MANSLFTEISKRCATVLCHLTVSTILHFTKISFIFFKHFKSQRYCKKLAWWFWNPIIVRFKQKYYLSHVAYPLHWYLRSPCQTDLDDFWLHKCMSLGPPSAARFLPLVFHLDELSVGDLQAAHVHLHKDSNGLVL